MIELLKGHTYDLTVSGVEIKDAKITSAKDGLYRLQIKDGGQYRTQRHHYLAFHIGQVTRAEAK